MYVDAIIKDFNEQISLYPNLHFYICSDGINIPVSIVEQSKIDLKDSILQTFMRTGITTTIDMYAYENSVILTKLKEYAKTKRNVYIINRLETFKDDSCANNYKIILDNKNLYIDCNHQSAYGGQLLGKYIIDSIKNNEDTFK